MKKIGLLGGSFNPIHNGHLQIAQYVLDELSLDEIIFIPCFSSPFYKEELIAYKERYQMVALAIEDYPLFKVSSIEEKLPLPNYTINTLKALADAECEYYFIVGGDQGCKLAKWYKIDELLTLCKMVVVARDSKVIDYEYDVISVNSPLIDISSTNVRSGNFNLVPKKVKNYILDNELYLEELVKSKMSEYRFNHTLNVQNLAIDLATIHHLDIHKVSLAALLHDIMKEAPSEIISELLDKDCINHRSYPKALLHQFAGAIYAYAYLGVEDSDVLEAIYYHTSGESDNTYTKLIYLADKLEKGRDYVFEELNELAKRDLDACFTLAKNEYFKKGI